jgi:hypothetical protein
VSLLHEIRGHPAVDAEPNANTGARPFLITVCAECEAMRSVLFLSRDRWYCTKCRAEGDARPTMIPMSKPRKG